MSFAMEDNLESGWVSVRPKIFDEKERHKFVFIVAWNDIEGKFAITCHNRTVQRRSTFLDPLLDCACACPSACVHPAVGASSVGDKQTKRPVAVVMKTDDVNKVRPNCAPKGKPMIKGGVGDKKKSKISDGSWDVVTPRVVDLDILEVVDIYEDAEAGESEGSSREDFSWAGLFSFQDLRAAHLQLCAVNSDLEPCLPSFPEEQSGLWSVLFGATSGVSQRETDALCYQLQVYLGHALDTCGWKILSQVLFTEGDDTEEYYESLSELRQKGYEDALERAKRRMQEVNKLSLTP